MSKSPKSVRQGDERNLYLRRLKATNAPLKHAENDRLNVKQSDTTRPNIVGTSQRSNVPLAKPNKKVNSAKQKLKSRTSNHYLQSFKGDKRLHDQLKIRTMKVQHQEGDSHSKGLKKEVAKGKKPDENVEKEREKKVENNQVDPSGVSTNGKASESPEQADHSENNVGKESNKKEPDNVKDDDDVIEIVKTQNGKEEMLDSHLEPDIEILDAVIEIESERAPTPVAQEEVQVSKKEETLSGSNVVESTTSEPSGQVDQKEDPQAKDDEPFVSYDSNIMLKDVQIKLNDCLKDNSKLLDVTDPNASITDHIKDLSFGRTLRGISGRTSLGRLRNVTMRERLMSPNDSLFVNTSRLSISQDRSIYLETADSSFHNCSRVERKRKRDEDIELMSKKLKSEEGYNFFNFSWDYLKNWRRPEPVNENVYKLNLDESKINDAIDVEGSGERKKWCIVM